MGSRPASSPVCPLLLPQFRTLKPEEQRQALRSLELHYQAFLRDSQDAGGFGPEDRLVAEREYSSCSRHYQQLLQSLEQGMGRAWLGYEQGRQAVGPATKWPDVPSGEQEESRCQRCISELKDIRLQLEACETRTVHRLRLPLDRDPARECAQRIAEQQAGAVPFPISPSQPHFTPPTAFQGCFVWGSGHQCAPTQSFLRKHRPRWKGWARELPASQLRPRRYWPCLNHRLLPPLCAQSWS